MKNAKKLVSLLVVLTILATCYSSVISYTHESGYIPFSEYSLQIRYTQNGPISYANMIDVSMQRWNMILPLDSTRGTYSSPDYIIYSDDYGNVSWAGKCWYPCPLNWLLGYKIKINDYAIGTNGYYAINVILHEVGHMYGLGHCSLATSVMKPVADPSINYPNYDDECGVEDIYGS